MYCIVYIREIVDDLVPNLSNPITSEHFFYVEAGHVLFLCQYRSRWPLIVLDGIQAISSLIQYST